MALTFLLFDLCQVDPAAAGNFGGLPYFISRLSLNSLTNNFNLSLG